MSNDPFNINVNSDALRENGELLRQASEKLAMENQLNVDSKKANIESLEVLKKIEMNTEYLKNIVDLLSVSNEHQKELNDLVQDILNIAKSPDEKEAQSRYRSVMKKIGDFSVITSSALNIAKLSSLAITVLQFFMQSH